MGLPLFVVASIVCDKCLLLSETPRIANIYVVAYLPAIPVSTTLPVNVAVISSVRC